MSPTCKVVNDKKRDNSNHSTVTCPARNAGENVPCEQRAGKDVFSENASVATILTTF